MFKLFLKYFYSNRALEKMYQASRPSTSDMNIRTKGIFYLALSMAITISVMLFSLHIDAISPDTYLQKKQGFAVFDLKNTPIQSTTALDSANCQDFAECADNNTFTNFQDNYELNKHLLVDDQSKQGPNTVKTIVLRLKIPKDTWQSALDQTKVDNESKQTRFLHFARFNFEKVSIYQENKQPITFFDSSHINIPIEEHESQSQDYILVMQTKQKNLRKFMKPSEPAFLATVKAHNAYKRFIEKYEFRYIAKVAFISKLVLALFALLVFLIIEGSPDALGLAIFLGFEALASSFGNTYRPSWMADGNYDFIRHYFFAMGDVFRIYFFCQLARMLPSKVKPWFIWGSVFALPYAYIRYIAPSFDWGSWINYLWVGRHLIVGVLAVLIMGRKVLYLHGKNLPWRVAALWLAIFASLGQTIDSGLYLFPQFRDQLEILNFIRMFRANSYFAFALSTFLNISNLENRVKSLSLLRLKSLKIEKELEIGQTVQESFLEIPKIPEEIELVSYYEAATYVSGDTYFVHWNPKAEVLTFLLNDIVGHGVQAGLKAFGCNIVAQTIWNDNIVQDRRAHRRGSLEKYDRDVIELICRKHNGSDFNAMLGAEFYLQTAELHLYRANYNFPTIIEPGEGPDNTWKVKDIALANRERAVVNLKKGSFVLLISDGLIETSREHFKLIKQLQKAINNVEHLSTSFLKELVIDKTKVSSADKNDDKTLLAFHWKG